MAHQLFSDPARPILSALSPPASLRAERTAVYECAKRLIDVGAALMLIVVGAPLLAVIAAGVTLSSPGPVLYRQRRLGRGGAHVWCYKFRSMVVNAEELLTRRPDLRARFERDYKLKDDPRVTRFGALLRRTSLDELPQLWNVLRGEMSLIGPRPIVDAELGHYGVHAEKMLSVKPGLGGLWQVSGRSDTTYAERITMDLRYVETRSVALDLRLLALTALTVIRGRGAY